VQPLLVVSKASAGIRSTTNIAPESGFEEKSSSWVSTIRQEKPRAHTTTWRPGYSEWRGRINLSGCWLDRPDSYRPNSCTSPQPGSFLSFDQSISRLTGRSIRGKSTGADAGTGTWMARAE
jgi:hypothetical protein